jgi:hypothetical protein
MTSRDNGIAASTESTNQSELEVEKKFPIFESTNLKQTLTSLGFEMTHQEEFVDWYFDLPAPIWHFTLSDIWIRYELRYQLFQPLANLVF